jgi:hypothetical protein
MPCGDVIWNVNEWGLAWRIALRRIEGAPAAVSEQVAFHHARLLQESCDTWLLQPVVGRLAWVD